MIEQEHKLRNKLDNIDKAHINKDSKEVENESEQSENNQ